jgi:integrase/recombinase XerD
MKINNAIILYLKELALLNRASGTIKSVKSALNHLLYFLEAEHIDDIEQLTADVLADYQQELYFCLTAKGKPLAVGTQIRLLCAVRSFTRFLNNKDYLAADPGRSIVLPKMVKPLPKTILSQKEIKTLIAACDMQNRNGFRRRLIIEILYDTGIRRGELAGLKITDIDHSAGYLHIRNGKGGKDRVVPVSQRVCKLIRNYRLFIRPTFVNGDDPGYLILNKYGNQLVGNGIYSEVRLAVEQSGIKKKITTHSLRHTCATHMLKNGAPIRHIQEMLGHDSLESTQIYTRVTINDLKKAHRQYHPSEKL